MYTIQLHNIYVNCAIYKLYTLCILYNIYSCVLLYNYTIYSERKEWWSVSLIYIRLDLMYIRFSLYIYTY